MQGFKSADIFWFINSATPFDLLSTAPAKGSMVGFWPLSRAFGTTGYSFTGKKVLTGPTSTDSSLIVGPFGNETFCFKSRSEYPAVAPFSLSSFTVVLYQRLPCEVINRTSSVILLANVIEIRTICDATGKRNGSVSRNRMEAGSPSVFRSDFRHQLVLPLGCLQCLVELAYSLFVACLGERIHQTWLVRKQQDSRGMINETRYLATPNPPHQ